MAGHIATSANFHWGTPERLLAPARRVFGGRIALDPCASPTSCVAILNWRGPPTDVDGLVERWRCPNAFVNPPFGTIYRHRETGIAITAKEYSQLTRPEKKLYQGIPINAWARKWVNEHRELGLEVIALTPANVDTTLWHEAIFPSVNVICFLDGRVTFEGAEQVAPMPIALSYWGDKPNYFAEEYEPLGEILVPRRHRRCA
jgi:hypothetical protein